MIYRFFSRTLGVVKSCRGLVWYKLPMRTVIQTNEAPLAIGPYSQAIRAGQFLFCSGQIAIHPQTGEMVAPTDVEMQAEQVLNNLSAVLRAGGADLDAIVKATIYLTRMDDFPLVNQVYAKRFNQAPPARATVEVSNLPKSALVEIDAIAVVE